MAKINGKRSPTLMSLRGALATKTQANLGGVAMRLACVFASLAMTRVNGYN